MRTPLRLALAVLLLSPAFLSAAESDAERAARLQRELDAERAEKIARMQKEIDDLHRRLESLERVLRNQDEYLRAQSTRQAGYFGLPPSVPPGNGTAPAPATATITVRNQYLHGATITINGRSWRAEAGQSQPLTITGVPVGSFTYEVSVDGYGVVQPPTSATLSARGHLITVYPR